MEIVANAEFTFRVVLKFSEGIFFGSRVALLNVHFILLFADISAMESSIDSMKSSDMTNVTSEVDANDTFVTQVEDELTGLTHTGIIEMKPEVTASRKHQNRKRANWPTC